MNTVELFILLGILALIFIIIYLKIITKRPIKHGNERCEKMLKELEDEPFNTTIGEDLYSAKSVKKKQ